MSFIFFYFIILTDILFVRQYSLTNKIKIIQLIIIVLYYTTPMSHHIHNPRPCSAILTSTMVPPAYPSSNDSSAIWQCLSWGTEANPRNMQCAHNKGQRYHLSQSAHLEPNRRLTIKCGCCDEGAYIQTSTAYQEHSDRQINYAQKQQEQTQRQIQTTQIQGNNSDTKRYVHQQKQTQGRTNVNTGNRQRGVSVDQNTRNKQPSKARSPRDEVIEPAYDRMAVEEIKKRRLNELLKSKQKTLERVKVEQFVQSQKPYTRGMSNTRFRTLFGKECMEAYGRNNTNEPIGGIIYGNHLKTFNINPHASSNDPKYYQTHTTALNFAKRTKLDEQKNWKLLQKQFGKQLQLTAVNKTLIPGKEVVYQEVTPQNMYSAMKVNHQFAKNNKQEVRQLEKDYKRNQVLNQWARQDEYKAQRAIDKETLKNAPLGSTMAGSEAEDEFRRAAGLPQQRLNRQVIYKLVDSDGNVRCGADRHSLTCFVDINFPQNSAAYTAQLMNRSPIFPIRVKQEDRNLDEIRKENYVESVVNNYPAHYLIPNVDYSKVVLKSKPNKQRSSSRSPPKQKRPQSYNPHTTVKAQTINRNQVEGQPIFQNTKVGGKVNKTDIRGNVIMSPKNQVAFENDKTNYLNQSTKVTLNNTHQGNPNRNQNQEHIAHSRYPSGHGSCNQSSQEACSRYVSTLKNALLQSSTKNPQFATELLVRANDNNRVGPTKNQRVVNQEYDARNYYPHANHEMKPKLHHSINATKIPYAGVESNILDAIH